MTDCFALLAEPRRPWLDPAALKDKFHRLGAEHHPDVTGKDGADFAAINTAYATLADPKTRVKHLLELEFPGAAVQGLQAPPPGITELFGTVARERRGAADFLEKRATMRSPLEITLAAPEKLAARDALERLEEKLAQEQQGFLTRLKALDTQWQEERRQPEALAEIHNGLSFTGKWLEQVRGDLARIAET